VLHIGTASVLFLQVSWFPTNSDVAPYYFPTSVAQLKARFATRYTGTMFQIADVGLAQRPGPDAAWRDLLFGNMYRVTGVHSVSAYTGMGHDAFHKALCLTYRGGACPDVYGRLWQPTAGGGPSLADQMRLQTVVVQRALIDAPQPPPGWSVAQRTDAVTVLRRDATLPWPTGRLGWSSPGTTVTADSAPNDQTETVVVHANPAHPGPQRLAFARIDWPGYQADANGVAIPVISGPAGLLQVQLPDGFSGTVHIHWSPPGLSTGLAATGLGLATIVLLSVIQIVRRRKQGLFEGAV
jgi:hypothetical protein